MADYLMRSDSPLNEHDWEQLDNLVTGIAKRQLVGRRVLPLFGPLGASAQTVPVDSFGGVGTGDEPVRRSGRAYTELRRISKDFVLDWQDIEAAHKGLVPLPLGPAGAAAASCAAAEDALIFRGDDGATGLLNAEGAAKAPMGDWSKGSAFDDVSVAIQKLNENSCPGPYALIVSPAGYARMQKPYGTTGALEIALVRELATDGVYQSPVLAEGEAVLIADGVPNVDLAVGIDLAVGYLGPEDMDHRFRIFETVAVRVKRPQAICTIA